MKKIIALLICFFVTQEALAASRCTITPGGFFKQERIDCSYRVTPIASSGVTQRDVLWELPLGTPPVGGWPVVLIYQGSFLEVEFSRKKNDSFGAYWEARTIKALLDAGYAVIAPRAAADLAWQTNILSPELLYELSADYTYLNNVFSAIEQGIFGPINSNRKYATGISSGGYNTSRMAVSWPGEFKALAVHSASYASCASSFCVLPINMPQDHPPTLFVQGYLDVIAPWFAMDLYYDRLLYEGIETSRLTELFGGHEWFPSSPNTILNWFNAYP